MAGRSSIWKTIILPPLLALLLYLLTTYLLLPAYRHLRAHSNYTLLPASPESVPFARGLYARVSDLLSRRRGSLTGAESLLGDEELDEGFGDFPNTMSAWERNDRSPRVPGSGESERRLSQELERGFRDSSDEEDDDRRRRSRR